MPEHSQDRRETLRVRRAPKISVFLILGAALGVFVAMILTFAFNGTAEASPNTGVEYSQGQVFGFLVLVCAPVGIVLGGILALILDRRSQSRTRQIAVDHESVHVDPEPGTNGDGPGH
jgi:hypothetical protein